MQVLRAAVTTAQESASPAARFAPRTAALCTLRSVSSANKQEGSITTTIATTARAVVQPCTNNTDNTPDPNASPRSPTPHFKTPTP